MIYNNMIYLSIYLSIYLYTYNIYIYCRWDVKFVCTSVLTLISLPHHQSRWASWALKENNARTFLYQPMKINLGARAKCIRRIYTCWWRSLGKEIIGVIWFIIIYRLYGHFKLHFSVKTCMSLATYLAHKKPCQCSQLQWPFRRIW